ncbi:spondin-2-like isoform X2 [Pectinophora gossypiella]|uniref:spondin-2-like isoform X2 n=1 Tax=Pectinophora gossypiella TaxID=13191 RepID=UPI00214E1515|nr:spondin-2-like isoform X2 [Pectinophora gossypiella]
MSILNSGKFLIVIFIIEEIFSFRCDRRPYGSITQSSAPDGRYRLEVVGLDKTYIPEQLYTVQITRTDEDSLFTMFTISAEGDTTPDPRNPRRLILLDAGQVSPMDQTTARYTVRCPNSVEQTISSPKDTVAVYWQAPMSGNGCVTLRAMVAENEAVWFEDGAPLTLRLCEDLSQPDDIAPVINNECSVCEEAKYEISFTGIWSRNTHPTLYPENDWVPRFSELVGASHSTEYNLWMPGSLASEGLKVLAEYANSSALEIEIREKIGDGVRTMIKGKGHGYLRMSTPSYSSFRADKVNHLITVAVALSPSPDWFLGVSRFELCSEENTWLEERELNLYPWDAGTDSGISYESVNIPTYPQDNINRVAMSSPDKNSPFFETDMKDLHPFGKLNLKLVRTYQRECEDTTDAGETPAPDGGGSDGAEDGNEPEEPSSEAPVVRDPETSEDCPMTQWAEWSICEGPCKDGRVDGYKWRERYHMINGKAVEKYDPNNPDAEGTEDTVPEYCKNNYEEFDGESCEEDCEETVTVERRVMTPIAPGHGWTSKRRDLPKVKN